MKLILTFINLAVLASLGVLLWFVVESQTDTTGFQFDKLMWVYVGVFSIGLGFKLLKKMTGWMTYSLMILGIIGVVFVTYVDDSGVIREWLQKFYQ